MESNFEKELEQLINKYSLENQSDTPDFILAAYVIQALENFNAATKQREEWYGRQPRVSDLPDDLPFPTEQQTPIDLETDPITDYDSTGNPPPQHPSSTI